MKYRSGLIFTDFFFNTLFVIEIEFGEFDNIEDALFHGNEVDYVKTSIVHNGFFIMLKNKKTYIVKNGTMKILKKEVLEGTTLKDRLSYNIWNENDFEVIKNSIQDYIFKKGSGVKMEIFAFFSSPIEGRK